MFSVQFDEMMFIRAGVEASMVLSFASPLRHGTEQSVTSTRIGVETKPAVLRFEKMPPTTVNVMDIVQIEVVPEIKGGSVL